MNRIARAATLIAFVAATAACEFEGDRIPGPFDPGQSGIPELTAVTESCGSGIVSALHRVSDAYVDIYAEWDRYQTYRQAIDENGVTDEERSGLEDRYQNIGRDLRSYERAVESARRAGARVDGLTAADCDRDVIAVFETVVQYKQAELDFVARESQTILNQTSAVVSTGATPETPTP